MWHMKMLFHCGCWVLNTSSQTLLDKLHYLNKTIRKSISDVYIKNKFHYLNKLAYD